MFYSPLVKKASLITFDAHKEDCDKSGYPYVMHPFYLAFQMEDENSVCVALLHDVIEDHGDKYSFDYLRQQGFNEDIISTLKLLTHDTLIPYMDYICHPSYNQTLLVLGKCMEQHSELHSHNQLCF